MLSLATKWGAFAFALFGVALAAARPTAAEDASTAETVEAHATKNPYEGDPEAIKQGQSLYNNTCLFCHGSKGKGARAPNLVEGLFRAVDGADDAIIYDIILKGRPGTIMGGFEGTFSENQIWQIISYLRQEGLEQSKAAN